LHNLTDEEWKAKKLSVATWEANVAELPQQKIIKEVLARNANATFGPNCYIAPDCNFFTDSARLGRNVRIASQVTLRGNIIMGNDVSVNPLTNIIGNVKIGNAVRIASSVQIFGFNHGFERVDKFIKDQPITSKGIDIGEGTWIGAGVSIVDGVSIGNNSVVAAGAVVTKSFPDFSVIGGTPARVIRSRIKAGDVKLEVTNIAKKSSQLDYCIDLPRTGLLDEKKRVINGWVASANEVTGLFKVVDNVKTKILDFHERPDVKNYLSGANPTLAQRASIIGFTVNDVQVGMDLHLSTTRSEMTLVRF